MEEAEILPKLNYNLRLTTVTEWVQIVSSQLTPMTEEAANVDDVGGQFSENKGEG